MALKSHGPDVTLIPWDFASPQHVQRLVHQRTACGWDDQEVEGWRASQESGKLNLQWIVLQDYDSEKEAKELKHTGTYPQEKELLIDSALSFGAKPRTIPQPQRSFIPVGHICLGRPVKKYSDFDENTKGMYWISNFYVSRALQASGLGRAAMDTVERLAIAEPLCATTLGLNAINKVDPDREEKYKVLGLDIPPFSNQEWYERRGYEVYKQIEKHFSKIDSTGKSWYWDAVYLKKNIV